MCRKGEESKRRKRLTEPRAAAGTARTEATTAYCDQPPGAKKQKKSLPLITSEQVKALVKETLDGIPNLSLDYSASWRAYPKFQVQGAKATLTLGGKFWTATTKSEAHAELGALAKAAAAEPMEIEEAGAEEAAAAPAAAAADGRDGIWIDETGHIVWKNGEIPEKAMKTRPNVTQK